MKKLISLVLVLATLLSLCTMAFAATSFQYTDYTNKDWYFRYVEKAIAKGWMNGVGGQDFAPNGTLNRSMFVTILHRIAGSPAPGKAAAFSDVVKGAWYENAVSWAAENGVVTGYEDGRFGVSDPLTREQMAAILFRYATKDGAPVTLEENLTGFSDNAEISSYAVTAMNWAVGQGIITGSGEKLMPKGTSTRAQAATVLVRFDAREEAATLTRADLEKAVVEMGWDYSLKGNKIQYDSENLTPDRINKYFSGTYRVTEDVAPEYGTVDTSIFSVCSDYCQKVYYNALNERFFGFPLDWVTVCLWNNSENVYGKDIVVARYWDDARLSKDKQRYGDIINTTTHRMTAQEMREFFINWETTMRPGDVLVPNGHAMLYVGDGYVIDCAGNKYNMESGADSYEGLGAVSQLRTVIGCFVDGNDPSSGSTWMFPAEGEANTPSFVVLRPINAIVTDDGDGDLGNDKAIDAVEITDAMETRLENRGMDISRYADIGSFGTAVSGGNITYNIAIINKTNESKYSTFRKAAESGYAGEDYKGLVVTETIPEGTELVEGSITEGGVYADGKITWTLDVPVGITKGLSYTVKVTAPLGAIIVSGGGFVGNIPSNVLRNKVGGEKLATGENSPFYDFYHRFNQGWDKTYGLTVTDDTSVAEEIYSKVLGKKLELPTAQELFESIYEQVHVNQRVALGYNRENRADAWMYTPIEGVYEKNPMLVRNYLGGTATWFKDDLDRINEFDASYMEPGDIVVYLTLSEYNNETPRTVTDTKVIVWLDGGNFATYDPATKTWDRSRSVKELWQAYLYDAFFVLRPTQAGALEDSGNQVKPTGELITHAETKQERQAAVVASAWAYLDKGEQVQHDAAAFTAVATSDGGNGRTGVFAAPESITSQLNWYSSVHGLMLSIFNDAMAHQYAPNSNAATYTRFAGLLDEYSNVFSWTSEDMAAVPKSAELIAKLEPGDLVVATVAKNDYVYGLYLGSGKITSYETDTKMRFDTKTGEDHKEVGGAAKVLNVSEVLTDDYLKSISTIYVARFVESPDYDTAFVTERAKSRIKYPRMVIDRTVNVGPFGSAVAGEKLTYTVTVENKSTAAYTGLPVVENIPAGTELVKAEGAKNENGVLTWSLDVPAGGSKTVSYTVKVVGKAGDRIVATGKVDNIPSNTLSTTVSNVFVTAEAEAKLKEFAGKTGEEIEKELGLGEKKALDKLRGAFSYALTGKTDADLIKVLPGGSEMRKLFTDSGKNRLNLYTVTTPETASNKKLRAMMVDGYYGGSKVHCDEILDRLMDLQTAHLEPGDFLSIAKADGYIFAIYLGEGKFLQTDYKDNTMTVVDETLLTTIFKRDNQYFALLRPGYVYAAADLK